MYSSLIGKIEKAKRYAQEPDRVRFARFSVTLRGEHSTHAISYEDGDWACDCHFFAGHGTCSHTMAMERILSGMVATASAKPVSLV
ncbi:MAG: hypothetical protein HYY00_07420 [Chloroflexi bacterium]|nr:hypothetical protein [Chloroflexota bacterium]